MDSFERIVQDYAENDSPHVIENASIDHALVLIGRLFETARRHKEEVRIVSGRLLKSFYQNLIDSARKVLDDGVQVSVVVLSNDDSQLNGNGFYDLLNRHKNGRVDVLDRDAESMPHFVVVGERRYRVEVDDKRKKAFAAFNDDTIAPVLVGIHAKLQETASGAAT